MKIVPIRIAFCVNLSMSGDPSQMDPLEQIAEHFQLQLVTGNYITGKSAGYEN